MAPRSGRTLHRMPAPALPEPALPQSGEPGALLDIDGTRNFRDLGGYVGAGGRRVRRGLVYRSDHLAFVTDRGVSSIDALGLRTVLDLRMPNERERQPSRLPPGPVVQHPNPRGADGAAQVEILEEVRAGRVTSVTEQDMADMYLSMLDEATEMFAAVVRAVAAPEALPVLFHCAAGKDRTGLAAALLLRLVGVDDDTIVRDYELTTHYRSAHRIAELRPELERVGVSIEAIVSMITAPPAAMRAALAWLDGVGGVEAYLTERCDVEPAVLAQVVATLLG